MRQALDDLLAQLANEEPLRSWLREAPSVLGVVQLTDIAQVVRVVAQTRPGQPTGGRTLPAGAVTARITEQGIKVPPVPGAVGQPGGSGIGL